MGLAATASKLLASLDLDTKPFEAGARRADGTVRKMESRFSRMGSSIKRGLGNAFSTGVGFLGAQIASKVIGGLWGQIKDAAIGMNASLETSTLQFETLIGDADKAREHVQSLFTFAARTPFETGPIIEASRIMRTFGGSTLDSKKNLTLFGNAAAAVSSDINEVSFWSSRLYAALEAGKPFGEASARLGELGIMAPKTRNQLEKMQKEGSKGPEIWAAYQKSLGRFDGAMEKQADSWAGLTSSVKDNIAILGATSLKPVFDTAKAGMKDFLAFLSTPQMEQAAKTFSADLAKFVNPENLRSIARTLKDNLPNAIAAFQSVPWGAMADAFKIMGGSAKVALDMFSAIPPWLQTAVLTGWGLNKLSGGLLGELGKGLIKGVLGINAGVVNVNAATVNGGGGVPGAVGGAGRFGGIAGNAAALIGPTAVVAGGMLTLQDIQSGTEEGVERGARAAMTGFPGMIGRAVTEAIGDPIGDYLNSPPKAPVDIVKVKPQGLSPDERQEHNDTQQRLTSLDDRLQAVRDRTRDVKFATDQARIANVAATRTGDASIVAAIRGIQRPVINVNVSQATTTVTYATGGTLSRYYGKTVPI